MKFRMLVPALGAVALAACTSGPAPQRSDGRAALFEAAAGKPVGSFDYFSSFYSWEPLNDHALVVYVRPRKAYLLDVAPCPQLPYAFRIGVTGRFDRVNTGLDSILTGRRDMPCRISRIRPLDLDRLKAAEAKSKREIDARPRSEAESGAPGDRD